MLLRRTELQDSIHNLYPPAVPPLRCLSCAPEYRRHKWQSIESRVANHSSCNSVLRSSMDPLRKGLSPTCLQHGKPLRSWPAPLSLSSGSSAHHRMLHHRLSKGTRPRVIKEPAPLSLS